MADSGGDSNKFLLVVLVGLGLFLTRLLNDMGGAAYRSIVRGGSFPFRRLLLVIVMLLGTMAACCVLYPDLIAVPPSGVPTPTTADHQ